MLNSKKIYSLIGEKIKEFREMSLLKTHEVSELIGVSEESYIEFENGKIIPYQVLDKLIDLYEIPPHVIMPTMEECNIMWIFMNGEAVQGRVKFRKTNDGVLRTVTDTNGNESKSFLRKYT